MATDYYGTEMQERRKRFNNIINGTSWDYVDSMVDDILGDKA